MFKVVKSILLVDDDQDDRYFFAKAMEEVDSSVSLVAASGGDEALEKLSTFTPDLILVDLVMPGMNGAAFLTAIKDNERLRNTRIVVYTAGLGIFGENDLKRLGAHDVCIKSEDLYGTVDKIRWLTGGSTYLKSA